MQMHAQRTGSSHMLNRRGAGAALAAVIVAARAPAVVGAASTVTYSHAGITCQAGLAAAQAQGYFRDEGLDLNVVPAPADNAAAMLRGEIDASLVIAWTLVPPFLAAGLTPGDIVATAGVQRGGFAMIVAPDSPLRTLADLRGQKVAASLTWRVMLSMSLAELGMDPLRDVDWQPALGPAQIAEALRSGQVAAATISDPFGVAMETAGTGRVLGWNNSDGMMDDYCCSVMLPAALIRMDRSKAAAITRAMMRGNAWTQANKAAAARLQIELGHISASLADNTRAIQAIDFVPAVAAARRNTEDMLMHGVRYGFLDPSTDVMGLVSRIFVPVTGELSGIVRLPATGDATPADDMEEMDG